MTERDRVCVDLGLGSPPNFPVSEGPGGCKGVSGLPGRDGVWGTPQPQSYGTTEFGITLGRRDEWKIRPRFPYSNLLRQPLFRSIT